MKAFLSFLKKQATLLIVAVVLFLVGGLALFASPNGDGSRTYNGKSPTYTNAQEQAYCQAKANNDKALAGLTGIDVPQDASSGCAPTDLPQMGALAYYEVDISTPDAFVGAVNGKGFNEGYGYQCVAGFKEFMYSLSGKYVAGNAKDYASKQSQVEPLGFTWHGGTTGLQNGDWAIWTVGEYGHVSMYYNGKWFGQNQYAADPNVGNPFNLASVSTNGIAGYYRPNVYQRQAPSAPTNSDSTSNSSTSNNDAANVSDIAATHTVQQGDTLGGIALSERWWGSASGLYGNDGYAQRLAQFNGISWRGLIFPNQVIKRAE